MNLPEVPQGKHTERPRGQRGKPQGGICRLRKTDGREERGQLSQKDWNSLVNSEYSKAVGLAPPRLTLRPCSPKVSVPESPVWAGCPVPSFHSPGKQ